MGPVLGDGEGFSSRQDELGGAFWARLFHYVRVGIKVYRYLAVSVLKLFMNSE
jgi:hypothetical protein